jgi:signal transduction histidine kinase
VDIEEQLRRNEKLSALGLLAAEVAHEIRNPLTVMKMLYHSLDLQFPDQDVRAKDARMIGEKMEHLNRIVERVLDLSRSAEPAFAPVNLNTLIEELALLVRHKLRNLKVDFVRQLATKLPDIIGDATQLEQALLNLVLNAAEAMPTGGTLTVRTLWATGASHARVEVQDTGPGMSEPDRLKAFTSLLQSSKSRGAGLGLAIVGRIIESHRGSIFIQTKHGHGTTVVIELPVE